MNKFAKALLLSLVLAAPVAMSTYAVQAKTANTHPQQLAQATTTKPRAKRHRVKHSMRRAKRAARRAAAAKR